jgi:tetratricopeptide (TPR) repeat protein
MRIPLVTLAAVLITSCATAPPLTTDTAAKPAPLFERLGDRSRAISTTHAQAQRYFDQGLTLAYGFNHAEAKRSFLAALKLDPRCAMCAWGASLVLGPNINLPMLEAANAEAYALARQAGSLAAGARLVEQALIEALQRRYSATWTADRAALDRDYANAMRRVAERFPDDADVQALFAESLMDLFPWNYWQPDGTPRPETLAAIAAIDRAIAREPRHPGALHYKIHALEEFRPQEAVAAADALRGLVPDAGHLVHMPGHIYLRVGRYSDALQVNLDAGQADDSYVAQCQVQGFYPVAYHPHNWHFVAVSATLLGQRAEAMRGAARTGHLMHGRAYDDAMVGLVVQHFDQLPLVTAVRFGLWDEVLATPKPVQSGDYALGLWHFGRGMAQSARGAASAAELELKALQAIVDKPEHRNAYVSVRSTVHSILAVAERMLAGELLLRERQYPLAIAALRQAAANEDALGYNEPEDWNYPVRLLLGTALLEAGQPQEAERAFQEDLRKHPENGWALYGLSLSLEALGKSAEAAQVRARFAQAWRHADIALSAAVVR